MVVRPCSLPVARPGWSRWQPCPVGQLDDATKAYRAAETAVRRAQRDATVRVQAARRTQTQARQRLHAAIIEAARGGMRQVEIMAVTGYSRDRVRTILRAGGIEG